MDRKRILRVGAIVAVAGGTGFVMQSQAKAPPTERLAVAGFAQADAPVAAITPVVADTTQPTVLVAATAPATLPTVTASESQPTAPVACSEDMALIARPGAMLDLGLLAPCRPDQRVLIRHGGLVVSAQTSAAGTVVATIPALQSPAEVTIAFADGTSVTQAAPVDDLARYDRFAVQWMADDAFQLHAYGVGAADGHVSAAAPREVSATGGFMISLGDPATDRPLMAEVFTWPAGKPATEGSVTLDIEAAVTEATCGREILGETITAMAGRLTVRDLTIAMPGCEAIGEYVVLPNPVAPEKLAAN